MEAATPSSTSTRTAAGASVQRLRPPPALPRPPPTSAPLQQLSSNQPSTVGVTASIRQRRQSARRQRETAASYAPPLRPSPLLQHPAWLQLALPENDSLTWRRAACRDPTATGTSEQERGGILRLLQAADSPHQLAVPQGSRGALNAYIHSTAELSAAVRAHLRTTRDPFYSRPPEINVNYGGKGASQQLWWCGDKGWKVTLPNRNLLKYLRTSGDDASGRPPAQSGGTDWNKRRRLIDDGTIPDDDVALLPPVEVPARVGLSDEEAKAMFAELQKKGWNMGWNAQQQPAPTSPADDESSGEFHTDADASRLPATYATSDSEGGWSPAPTSPADYESSGESHTDADASRLPATYATSDSEGGWSSEDILESCVLVPAVELAWDDDDGLPPAIHIEEADCLPPVERHPLSELDSSNEVMAVDSDATHERKVSATLHPESLATPVMTARPAVVNNPLNSEGGDTYGFQGADRVAASHGAETKPVSSPAQIDSKSVAGAEDPVPLQATFAVPAGALPGQTLKLQIGKRQFGVELPQGTKEGQTLRVDTSAALAGVAAARTHYSGGGSSSRQGRGRSGGEVLAVAMAAATGCVGIFVALQVLNSAGLIAAIALLASLMMIRQLNRQFVYRSLDQPLTMDEDALLALALLLSHVSVIAMAMQTYDTWLSSTNSLAAPGDNVGYVAGSIPLFTCQMFVHAVIGIGQARYLASMGTRYGGGIAAETPQGGYLCWMTLVLFPFAVQIVGFLFWEAHTCDRLYAAPEVNGTNLPSAKCLDDIGFFLRCSGSVLLLLSLTAAQASNRGSLATAIFPFSAVFLLVWAADIGRGTAAGCPLGADCSGRLTPLLILPLLASYLAGVNLFVRSTSKWTEATTTALSFSILFCQMAAATTGGMDLNLLGAVTENMHYQEHDTGSLSNERFSEAALPLWLTQFVFIPVVLLDRAAMPIFALMLGSGMLGGEVVLVTLPVAAVVGAVVIKFTPVPVDGLSLALNGFNLGLVEIAPENDEGPDNRSRAAVCVWITPCLALGYVISSWAVALHGTRSDTSVIAATAQQGTISAVRLSAVAIFAPFLLGCSHIYFHRTRPGVAYCSMAGAVFLTAGAWFDEGLTWACLAICVPALVVMQARQSDYCSCRDDEDAKLQTGRRSARELVHMVCSLVLFFFICFHRLSWQHAWVCLCLLYALCWVPLSVSVHELRRETRPTSQKATSVPFLQMRLWRAGLIGPLLCTVPSTFWSVEEGQMMCDADLLQAQSEQCEESFTWVLLMVVPVAMVMVEWAATELSVLRCGCAYWSSISTMQRARACAIIMVAACALPFRIWLHMAQIRGIQFMRANCTDVDSEVHMGAAFTAIIATACVLLYIICGVLERVSPQKGATAVPPTQGMAAALLCMAFLDYYTPILAVPMVLASSYMSYASHWLSAHEGSWPTALLAAPVVWLAKSGVGAFRGMEKALWGVHIFGMSPSEDLAIFVDRFNFWWTPFMGTVLLMWGVGVRVYLVPKWPDDTERGEFSWEKLFYVTDAISFYAAVLMMAPLTQGWVCVVLSVMAILWGLHVQDTTVVLRSPALYISSFLIIEAYQDVKIGSWSFAATSLACLTSAVVTHFVAQPRNTKIVSAEQPQHQDLSGLVDLTILWAFLVAWLDGPHGTTKGCLVCGLSIMSLPFLQWRGYPFLLVFTPLMLSLSMFYCLTSVGIGDSLYRQTISAISGSIYGLLLSLMSIVGVNPNGNVGLIALFVDNDFVLVSNDDTQATWFMRKTPVTKEGYHNLLFGVGACWIFAHAVVGLYWTEISIEGCLLITMISGCTLIAQGTSRSSANLRLAGHLQICIGILLGAAAPGVSPVCRATDADLCADADTALECLNTTITSQSCAWLATEAKCRAADKFVCEDYFLHGRSECLGAGKCQYDEGNHLLRSVLILVGSCCTLGWTIMFCSAGCCCNVEAFSHTTAEEIRPSTVLRTIPTVADNDVQTNPMNTQILHPAFKRHENSNSVEGRSQRLQDAETNFVQALVAEGPRRNSSVAAEHARMVAGRVSAAVRLIRKQAKVEPRSVVVTTERLNVRQAPSSDATILRKLPRGTRIWVVGNHGPWLELAAQEAQTADQLVQGAGWILGRADGASYALVQ